MHADLDALATALYVTVDDMLITNPDLIPQRPQIGIAPVLTDAELITLSVIQALLGFTSETRFIRHAHIELRHLFPYIPDRAGYNKRLRHATDMLRGVTRLLATACTSWTNDVWLLDSTPVECARSRETVKRSNLAGAAGYGYCTSHSRFFWGFRLHLIATPSGLPITYALSNPKQDERNIARDMLEIEPDLLAQRHGQTIIADKGYRSTEFEAMLNANGATLIRPTYSKEPTRPGQRFLRPFRQIIESINQTLKAQLDLERHAARTFAGITARVLQRILALTAAIWHNELTHQPVLRSLTAYDH
ncbi:MAG: IS982 family transposase [Mycobacterium sp.]